jgi:hypothetical protein
VGTRGVPGALLVAVEVLPYELIGEGGKAFEGKRFRFGEDESTGVPYQRIEHLREDLDVGVIVVHCRADELFECFDESALAAFEALAKTGVLLSTRVQMARHRSGCSVTVRRYSCSTAVIVARGLSIGPAGSTSASSGVIHAQMAFIGIGATDCRS